MSRNCYRLLCSKNELQLKGTLNGGQSFRWSNRENDKWIGVFGNKLWILAQEDNSISYEVYEDEQTTEPFNTKLRLSKEETYNKLLTEYFRLDISIKDYYEKWSQRDLYFKKAAKQFYGIRILKQDLVENIFSFICSSNNNIARISSMVHKLAKFYGNKICELEDISYYEFPSVECLAKPEVEEVLRTNGFGYRAKYISRSAQIIMENGGNSWLEKLKFMDYPEAKKTLMTLTGIGAKVADCICLMSLGHLQAIPVDTHIYQIASRLYLPQIAKQKTVTEKIYNEIGEHFRDLYGPMAGWAHTVLFCADLKKFQTNTTFDGDSNKITKQRKRKK